MTPNSNHVKFPWVVLKQVPMILFSSVEWFGNRALSGFHWVGPESDLRWISLSVPESLFYRFQPCLHWISWRGPKSLSLSIMLSCMEPYIPWIPLSSQESYLCWILLSGMESLSLSISLSGLEPCLHWILLSGQESLLSINSVEWSGTLFCLILLSGHESISLIVPLSGLEPNLHLTSVELV